MTCETCGLPGPHVSDRDCVAALRLELERLRNMLRLAQLAAAGAFDY